MSLAGVGFVAYNDIEFDAANLETLSIDGKPLPDSSGRTVKAVEYTIALSGYVQNDSGTDSELETIRQGLTAYGGSLFYTGRGFGIDSLIVNSDVDENDDPIENPIWDADWGPKPTLLRFKPVGGAQAAKITWTCTTTIPECSNAAYQFALMEFCYKIRFSIDRAGYTRMNYTGHITIPQTRAMQSSRALQDCADNYREQIFATCPQGFRPEDFDFDIDESKNRLEFSFVYTELPAPLPPYVVDCSAEHSVDWDAKSGIAMARLTADYELMKGTDPNTAWQYFFSMLQERIQQSNTDNSNADGNQGANVLLWGLSLRQPEIFGRNRAVFAAQYQIITTLDKLLGASGLFLPVSMADDSAWRATYINCVSDRGYANLQLTPSMDMIIDLCIQNQPTLPDQPGATLPVDTTLNISDMFPYPDAQTSWIEYKLFARYESNDNITELKSLPATPVTPDSSAGTPPQFELLTGTLQDNGQPGGDTIDSNQSNYSPPYTDTSTVSSVVQTRSLPYVYVILTGRAVRAGYPVAQPVVTSISGVTPIPANRQGIDGFWSGTLASPSDIPVIGARWSLRYLLPQIPAGGLGVPPNPIYGP